MSRIRANGLRSCLSDTVCSCFAEVSLGGVRRLKPRRIGGCSVSESYVVAGVFGCTQWQIVLLLSRGVVFFVGGHEVDHI